MKKQGISESRVKNVYLSLGSNLGNRSKNINDAKYLLNIFDINVVKSSNFYETESWPNKYFPKYLNIALKISTPMTVDQLFRRIK